MKDIYSAIDDNNLDAIKKIIQSKPHKVHLWLAILFNASSRRRWGIVSWLLQNNTSLDPKSEIAKDVFFDAARDGQIDILAALLERDVNINCLTSRDTETAIFLAASKNQWETVAWLANHEAALSLSGHNNDKMPLLYQAVRSNHFVVIELLVTKGADINQLYQGQSTLSLALEYRKWPTAAFLLTKGALTNEQDIIIILDGAIKTGQMEFFQWIKQQKINIHKLNPLLFFKAIHCRHWDFVRYMISSGVQYNANRYQCDIEAIVEDHCWDLIRPLVRMGISPNSLIKSHNETLFQIACRLKHWKTVEYLTHHDANVNLQNEHGDTALHQAILAGRSKTVKILLVHQANMTIENHQGKTAIQLLVTSHNEQFKNKIQLLFEQKYSVNTSPNSPSHYYHHPINYRLSAIYLKNKLETQHKKGLIALHCTRNL